MNPSAFKYPKQVAFADTDASGWMHFPNVFRYFEEAEHAFLGSHDLLVFDRAHGGWPRVNVSCDYRKPLLCCDQIEVCLSITHIGNSSVKWDFEIVKSDGQSAASGSVTTVRVNHEGKPQPLSQPERQALSLILL